MTRVGILRCRPVQRIPACLRCRASRDARQPPPAPLVIDPHDSALASRPPAEARPLLAALGPEDRRHRGDVRRRRRRPRLHRRGPLYDAWVDRVDAGLPVRSRDPPVRRHRRRALPRTRSPADARAHGAARLPHRRPRPRLQQRLDLRRPVAADERGPHPRERLGARVLRDGPQGVGRDAGRALDRPRAGRRGGTASSRRSTGRSRSSPTRSGRCARSRSPTAWATPSVARTTSTIRCSGG